MNIDHLDTLVGVGSHRYIYEPNDKLVNLFINALLHSWSACFYDSDVRYVRTKLLNKNKIALLSQDATRTDYTLVGLNMRNEIKLEMIARMDMETIGEPWEVN